MTHKISFKDDYSNGCHPMVADAIYSNSAVFDAPYGKDAYSKALQDLVRETCNNPALTIHFASSGTMANTVMLASILKPYQAVIAAESAHINQHEAGAIEASGHKIIAVASTDGKIVVDELQKTMNSYMDHHMAMPKAVYLSNATEMGTVYSRKELTAIRSFCLHNDLFLVIDGARIGQGIAADPDVDMAFIASIADIFYVGGAKNGAWLGDMLIVNPLRLQDDLIHHLKQRGGLLPKARFIALQFHTLFKEELYIKLASLAREKAMHTAHALDKKGIEFRYKPQTNQIFPILNNDKIEKLQSQFLFYTWEKHSVNESVVRFVMSWDTKDEDVVALVNAL